MSATEDERHVLQCLLHDCLREADESGHRIAQRIQAYPLINESPFATDFAVERIDHATALVGNHWLNSITFAYAIANHLHRRIDSEASDCIALRIWQDSMLLANAGELMCRVTMSSPSHHGWLCGLLMGAVEISAHLNSAGRVDSARSNSHRSGVSVAEVSQLLCALGVEKELDIVADSREPANAWNALSAAFKFTKSMVAIPWAHSMLSSIPTLNWPSTLNALLARRIKELEASSNVFATVVWQHAIQQHR